VIPDSVYVLDRNRLWNPPMELYNDSDIDDFVDRQQIMHEELLRRDRSPRNMDRYYRELEELENAYVDNRIIEARPSEVLNVEHLDRSRLWNPNNVDWGAVQTQLQNWPRVEGPTLVDDETGLNVPQVNDVVGNDEIVFRRERSPRRYEEDEQQRIDEFRQQRYLQELANVNKSIRREALGQDQPGVIGNERLQNEIDFWINPDYQPVEHVTVDNGYHGVPNLEFNLEDGPMNDAEMKVSDDPQWIDQADRQFNIDEHDLELYEQMGLPAPPSDQPGVYNVIRTPEGEEILQAPEVYRQRRNQAARDKWREKRIMDEINRGRIRDLKAMKDFNDLRAKERRFATERRRVKEQESRNRARPSRAEELKRLSNENRFRRQYDRVIENLTPGYAGYINPRDRPLRRYVVVEDNEEDGESYLERLRRKRKAPRRYFEHSERRVRPRTGFVVENTEAAPIVRDVGVQIVEDDSPRLQARRRRERFLAARRALFEDEEDSYTRQQTNMRNREIMRELKRELKSRPKKGW
jgi:hypothetical protein